MKREPITHFGENAECSFEIGENSLSALDLQTCTSEIVLHMLMGTSQSEVDPSNRPAFSLKARLGKLGEI